MNIVIVLGMAVLGFIFGLVGTGYTKKPKVPKLYLSFKIGKNRLHVHHWMWVGTVLMIWAILMLTGVLNHDALWLNLLFGFGLGYMTQGFFVRDAFKIWNYDLLKEAEKF